MNIFFLKKNFFRILMAGISLIALSTHASTHFISGFVATQPVAIPNVYLIDANNFVTKVTGKLGGRTIGGNSSIKRLTTVTPGKLGGRTIGGNSAPVNTVSPCAGKLGGRTIGGNSPIDFTAIKLGNNSFLAQATVGAYKRGVFFEISNNNIKVTAARYCPLTKCQNRNLALTDSYAIVASSQTIGDYGIFDLVLSITHTHFNQHFISGFISTQGVAIPNTPPIEANGAINQITGKLGGGLIDNSEIGFTAIKLGDQSFLAQIIEKNYKKGVFFEVSDDGKIKVTQARYCLLIDCQDRNLALTDVHVAIADSQTANGYGIFDLVLSTVHLNANERLISDFIGTQSVAIPDAHLINENNIITEITGKLGGNTMDNGESILDFTVIRLGTNSFLAQAIVGTHKKGVFFEIEANSKIKVTQARSCLLIECKNRNLALTDTHVAIASEQTADGYGIVSLILSTTHFDANERFIPGFVTTQPVVIPSYLIDANNVVTKVTGKFGGNGIEGEDRIDFTAIKLSDNSFLAQVATGGLYKKGVFFEIEKNKIKVTQARSCLLTECKHRHLTLTDTPVAVADKQTVDGYGIFDLTLSTTHFNFNQHFISDFITTQGVTIPNAHLINANNIVTKITGKFAGTLIDGVLDFTAIQLGDKSFLAQVVVNNHKKGVFFEIEGDKVKLTTARDCPLADCQQYLTDSYKTIANSQTVGEYGIFGLTLSTTHLDANQHFISGFATMQGKAIPNANLINTSNVVTKIVGKFVDGSIKGAIDFTAINLGGNLFLAQVVTGTHKKGVFFKIENGKIKVTAARYCLLATCQDRNLVLTDPHSEIANNQTADGYNIFNLIASTRPLYSNEHFVSSFVTTGGVAIPNALVINASNVVTKITGEFGGAAIGAAINFTAISLGGNSFLAQVTANGYKKGIFFEIKNNKIKATAARYCALTACRSRMLALTDSHATIASSQTVGSYGIFNLVLSTTRINRNNYFIPGFVTTQGVVIPNGHLINESNPVTHITGKFGGESVGLPIEFTAIKLGNNSFLAQVVAGKYKKGVFFKIDDNNAIKATHARYCILTKCQNRNLTIADRYIGITTNSKSRGYGIFDLMLSTTAVALNSRSRFISGFVATEPVAIPNAHILNENRIITKITGKLAGMHVNGFINFTAIKLDGNSFLAQGIDKGYKKGVFFEIRENNKIVATAARYCALRICKNRHLTLTDSHTVVANSQTAAGYGIFDLTLSIAPVVAIKSTGSFGFVSGFVPVTPIAISDFYGGKIIEITGNFGGSGVKGLSVGFTAISLGNNLFLAQITQGIYKKGVFFEVDNNGKIKVTQARYCLLTNCQNRNLTLTDHRASVAINHGHLMIDGFGYDRNLTLTDHRASVAINHGHPAIDDFGYGIFDLRITSLVTNLALNKTATQSSTSVAHGTGQQAFALKAVDGNTNGSLESGSNHSVSSTNKEQGAWWQVDLGGAKLIQQIRIFNRTDCCKDRLTNYQVSVSNNADFTTTTYQQDFHTYPNSRQVIDLRLPRIQGSYVKIQLLGNNYLSLAEVQVLGYDLVPETSD
ncbi:Ferric siderophore transport system, periplasmic binding protein TonB [uncultured Gammaproteobacteria bacterium]|nr:Ferric siderophore transport system, periplasmic binding protein TonB [uncultured Gammaproteobacteria bacterium]